MNIFLKATSFLLFLWIEQAWSNRASLQAERTTLTEILNGYDPTVRPGGINETGPVIVEVSTFIRHMDDIDDVKMVFDAQFTLRQSWRDNRLKYNTTDVSYVTLTKPEQIWLPDLFFSNEESGYTHNIFQPNVLIRIYPNGQVLYSTRVSMRLFCQMNLKNYPLDYQVCNVHLASYGYVSEDVYFLWKVEDAVQITKHLNLRKFKLNMFGLDYCNAKTPTGVYSCLNLEFYFSRYFYHYLETAYMPATALVLMSWIVFWLNPHYSNIRFGIWTGILISMILVVTSVNNKAPETPYRKALDVWMGVCVTFVFFVLIELGVVNVVISKSDACLKQNHLTNIGSTIESNCVKVEDLRGHSQLRKYCSTPLKWYTNCTTKAQKIDLISRIMFPVTFLIFFFVYWIVYNDKQKDCLSDNCTILINAK